MQIATVLVVEQDILVRQPLAQYLRDCGYRVREAVDGDEARATLSSGRHTVDVALIGVKSLPSESGFALASWIRDHQPDVRVLLGGTITKVLQLAGDLCNDAPDGGLDYRTVLDQIRRLVAARNRGRTS
jgi:DNA-binding response OmpR family regulator